MSDVGERYATETQRVAELQHLAVTQDLKKLFEDTQWTVEQLSCVAGIGVCRLMSRAYHDRILICKDDRLKIAKNWAGTCWMSWQTYLSRTGLIVLNHMSFDWFGPFRYTVKYTNICIVQSSARQVGG